jgi:hypothetical protein
MSKAIGPDDQLHACVYGAASLGARHRCYAWKASSMSVSRIGCLAWIVISVVLSVILTVILNLII